MALNTNTCSPNNGTFIKFAFDGIAVTSAGAPLGEFRNLTRTAPGGKFISRSS